METVSACLQRPWLPNSWLTELTEGGATGLVTQISRDIVSKYGRHMPARISLCSIKSHHSNISLQLAFLTSYACDTNSYKMAWRNQGITGSNNIPLGRRRFGGDEEAGSTPGSAVVDNGVKRGRSPVRGTYLR